ncbi:MAG: hypothetical protein Tp176DCM1853251_39 [Prokaryotic dsDNA virus sp.]|nr:MAG: hypothetical protein Tp176DCM1853251_39 [Prokaryotic dsDNA virus sp.]|tara:strand:- start:4699 stop:4884 length:186 start_codon:yes stop_codon:yes gene_type:complete
MSGRTPGKRVSDIRPGDVVRGTAHLCACGCGVLFIASARAEYYSVNCKKRARYRRLKGEAK